MDIERRLMNIDQWIQGADEDIEGASQEDETCADCDAAYHDWVFMDEAMTTVMVGCNTAWVLWALTQIIYLIFLGKISVLLMFLHVGVTGGGLVAWWLRRSHRQHGYCQAHEPDETDVS